LCILKHFNTLKHAYHLPDEWCKFFCVTTIYKV